MRTLVRTASILLVAGFALNAQASVKSDLERTIRLWESGRFSEAIDLQTEVRAMMMERHAESLREVLPVIDGMNRDTDCTITSLDATVAARYSHGDSWFKFVVYVPGSGDRADAMREIIRGYTADLDASTLTVSGHGALLESGERNSIVVPLGGDRLLVDLSGNVTSAELIERANTLDWASIEKYFGLE